MSRSERENRTLADEVIFLKAEVERLTVERDFLRDGLAKVEADRDAAADRITRLAAERDAAVAALVVSLGYEFGRIPLATVRELREAAWSDIDHWLKQPKQAARLAARPEPEPERTAE